MSAEKGVVVDLSTCSESWLPRSSDIGLAAGVSDTTLADFIARGLRRVIYDLAFVDRVHAPRIDGARTWIVTDSIQKPQVLHEVAEFAQSMDGFGRAAAVISAVADELLLNALYAAPVDDEGARVFAALPRSTAVTSDRDITLTLAIDAGDLVLRCHDGYGSMERERVAESFARGLRAGPTQIAPHAPGAGLGLYLVYRQTSALWIDVDPGRSTDVTVLIPRRRTTPKLLALGLTV